MVLRELWEELKESQFEPAGFELAFGGEGGLPPIPIPNTAMNALLRGVIDRMDVWERYYRVVDYKTGKKDFDYCDVFNGVGLQMLLYLFALADAGEETPEDSLIPAGVQYFPARAEYIPSDGRLTPQEADQARKSKWKRRGLLLKDREVLQAMEPGDKPRRLDYAVRSGGDLTGALADREQMRLLKRYVFHVLADTVSDIASGDVTPNPYTRGTSHNACAFCPYGAVCHKETVEGRRNYKAMSAQQFWEEIDKEMKRHGG